MLIHALCLIFINVLSLPFVFHKVVKNLVYRGLNDFLIRLEKEKELIVVNEYVDPVLEMAEVTDRITKSDGRAILFCNNGTPFPVLMNMFGSTRRMAAAIGCENLDEAVRDIEKLAALMSGNKRGILASVSSLRQAAGIAALMPRKTAGRGRCQQVVMREPSLDILPAIKCWPHDGGRFITLPAVHTFHPETGKRNTGMYRMQVFDRLTTGMHWHRHKTGAVHYEAWKKNGGPMPVAVTLGGDPVYTYAATAPLPENIDEYILAGFLRKKRVKLVHCITQDIWVPSDADIVIEGYIDTSEELRPEGPFGDHTGVYSLTDNYPVFHVTAITHAKDAVYPATIVGVPPMEDAWIGEATEKLFLHPIKLALAPELADIHMPHAGTAHNLVIAKIEKRYPGQGMKVLSTLFGAGQMMFSKYIVLVSGEVEIRDYQSVMTAVEQNCSFENDLMIIRGPLDVLDHSADNFSYGSKMGIDATVKLPGEKRNDLYPFMSVTDLNNIMVKAKVFFSDMIVRYHIPFRGVLLLSLSALRAGEALLKLKDYFSGAGTNGYRFITAILEEGVSIENLLLTVWQLTGNTDPARDILLSGNPVIDGGFKLPARDAFARQWPNVITSDSDTMDAIDKNWEAVTGLEFIASPSRRIIGLVRGSGPCAVESDLR